MPDLLRNPPDLESELRRLLAQVPRGRVTTCGRLAGALGDPVAARWVGQFLLHHAHGEGCPCHRVVSSTGATGGYVSGEAEEKRHRLADEGVASIDGHVELERFVWDEFQGSVPLEQLRATQETIRGLVRLRHWRRWPRLVAGVDLAYPRPGWSRAAYTLHQPATGNLEWSHTISRRVRFPYISSYLSFRELPILLELLDEVREQGRMAEVVMVDGSGILHPRRAGIASHLGVAAKVPTIGLTKKLLLGKLDSEGDGGEEEGWASPQCTPIRHQGELLGVAIYRDSGSARPVYLSPGHGVDVDFCQRLGVHLFRGHRLPEPIYWADRLSRCGKN